MSDSINLKPVFRMLCVRCHRTMLSHGSPVTSCYYCGGNVRPADGVSGTALPDLASRLTALVDQYWDLAYAEGKEDRQHDTPGGDAQRVRWEICHAIRQLAGGVAVPAGPSSKPVTARFVVKKESGSEWARVIDTNTGEQIARYNVMPRKRSTRDGWKEAGSHAARLNAAAGAKDKAQPLTEGRCVRGEECECNSEAYLGCVSWRAAGVGACVEPSSKGVTDKP